MNPPTATVTNATIISSLLPNANVTSYTTSPPIAPSEVSPNTAISDRPKVKSVSKKDSKNNRKAVQASAAYREGLAAGRAAGREAAAAAASSIENAILKTDFTPNLVRFIYFILLNKLLVFMLF